MYLPALTGVSGIFYVVPPEEAVLCNASSKINYHSDRYGNLRRAWWNCDDYSCCDRNYRDYWKYVCRRESVSSAKLSIRLLKGLAIGTASHAMGTAKAMEIGEIEGAMSSLSIAVAGLMTVVGASIFYHLY